MRDFSFLIVLLCTFISCSPSAKPYYFNTHKTQTARIFPVATESASVDENIFVLPENITMEASTTASTLSASTKTFPRTKTFFNARKEDQSHPVTLLGDSVVLKKSRLSEEQRENNRKGYAITGFVFAVGAVITLFASIPAAMLIFFVLSIAFSIPGLRSKRFRGFAIAALTLASLMTILFAVALYTYG